MSTIEDILSSEGTLVYKTRGVSMNPMLKQDRDLVIIQAPVSRLKKYDVALYKRGENYVLHRVIEVGDDYYLIRGDNTFALEKVMDSNVIGVLTEFKRKGKLHKTSDRGYVLYAKCWDKLYPVRAGVHRSVGFAKSLSRRIGFTAFVKEHLGKN